MSLSSMSLLPIFGAALALPTPTSHTLLQAASADVSLPAIIPAAAAACAYRNSNLLPLLANKSDLVGACETLTTAGWTLSDSFNVVDPTTGDTDNADLHTSGGECLLAFHGDDLSESGLTAYEYKGNGTWNGNTTFYGVPGIMGLLTDETETLLSAMREKYGSLANLTSTRCPDKLFLVGHSSGGGIAYLVAHMANLPTDPLGMQKAADGVYMYGTGTYSLEPLTNALSDDGCFNGMYYYMRVPGGTDPGHGAYADMTKTSYWSVFGFTASLKMPSMSLDMAGPATVADAQLGPVVSTLCGNEPPVFTEMAGNATLLGHASAQRLIALGGHFGTHEPIAYLSAFK